MEITKECENCKYGEITAFNEYPCSQCDENYSLWESMVYKALTPTDETQWAHNNRVSFPVPDKAGEVQRPNIKDYFGKDADLKTVMAIYDNQPELFNYCQALDRYIDDTLLGNKKKPYRGNNRTS